MTEHFRGKGVLENTTSHVLDMGKQVTRGRGVLNIGQKNYTLLVDALNANSTLTSGRTKYAYLPKDKQQRADLEGIKLIADSNFSRVSHVPTYRRIEKMFFVDLSKTLICQGSAIRSSFHFRMFQNCSKRNVVSPNEMCMIRIHTFLGPSTSKVYVD